VIVGRLNGWSDDGLAIARKVRQLVFKPLGQAIGWPVVWEAGRFASLSAIGWQCQVGWLIGSSWPVGLHLACQ